jgi:hypothetical protein
MYWVSARADPAFPSYRGAGAGSRPSTPAYARLGGGRTPRVLACHPERNAPSRWRPRPASRLTAAEATATRRAINLGRSVLGAIGNLREPWARAQVGARSLSRKERTISHTPCAHRAPVPVTDAGVRVARGSNSRGVSLEARVLRGRRDSVRQGEARTRGDGFRGAGRCQPQD